MTTQPLERSLTWICHPDDFVPQRLIALEKNMHRKYSRAAQRNSFNFFFIPDNELIPTVVDQSELGYQGLPAVGETIGKKVLTLADTFFQWAGRRSKEYTYTI